MIDKNLKNFVQTYDKDLSSIYRFCCMKIRDHELAKDITQQAFLKTWGYLESEDKKVNIRALVYKITNNLIIDWYRKKKESSLDTMIEKGFDPADETEIERETSLKSTFKILDKLSDPDRELIMLRYVNNLKPKEIAKILDEEVNIVSVRIHRARKKLKEVINKEGYELF